MMITIAFILGAISGIVILSLCVISKKYNDDLCNVGLDIYYEIMDKLDKLPEDYDISDLKLIIKESFRQFGFTNIIISVSNVKGDEKDE